MLFKCLILSILFNTLFASPPGSRNIASNTSHEKNSRDDKRTQAFTSTSYPSNSHSGSGPQLLPLDLSIKNRQPDQYATASTSGISFDCNKCGQKFLRKVYLEQHDRVTHQGITFGCGMCGRKFTRKDGLVNHVRAEHLENSEMYKCDRCPYQTKHKRTLASHKYRSH